MPRIDFHTNITDKLAYACRLTRKAYGARARVVLLADGPDQAAALDAALWALSEVDFLPHVRAGAALAARTPIIVADADDAPLPHHDMLVNLTRQRPAHVDRFARVFEIISTDADDAAAGRQRYVAYKQQSYPLTHFVANQA
jgi:DNA polymerase-3 subunit chi